MWDYKSNTFSEIIFKKGWNIVNIIHCKCNTFWKNNLLIIYYLLKNWLSKIIAIYLNFYPTVKKNQKGCWSLTKRNCIKRSKDKHSCVKSKEIVPFTSFITQMTASFILITKIMHAYICTMFFFAVLLKKLRSNLFSPRH